MVVYLAYGSTANFRFRGSIAKINISKERQDYGDRSGPRILEIYSVIQKLSRFPQVQSECEWTFVSITSDKNNYSHFIITLFMLFYKQQMPRI